MRSRIGSAFLALVAVGLAWTWVKPVHVQVAHGERWEYCRVDRGNYANGSWEARVAYFANAAGGWRAETVAAESLPAGENSNTELDVSIRRAIARLGADGWEMVGPGPGSLADTINGHGAFYFKRRLP
jgi:hypothetical protein